MTTFVRNGVTYTIVYIDPSIASAGDGSTAATALKNFPSSLANNKCYLVRRCDGTVGASWATSQSSVVNMMVLGMPKSTDEFYDLIDNDTKTAWDADTYDYGVITQSSSNNPTMSSAKNILFHGIYFNKTYTSYTGWFTVASSSTYADSFTMTGCKVGSINCPLDDANWITDHTLTNNEKQYFSYRFTIYAKYVNVSNNIINAKPYAASSSGSDCFGISCSENASVLNNQTNILVDSASNANYNYVFNVTGSFNTANIINDNVKCIIPSTWISGGNFYMGVFLRVYNNSLYKSTLNIDNINATSVPMNGGSVGVASGSSNDSYAFINIENFAGGFLSVKNIDIDFGSNTGAKLNGVACFRLGPLYREYKTDVEIDNVNIRLGEVLSECAMSTMLPNFSAFQLVDSCSYGSNIVFNNVNVIAPHQRAIYVTSSGAVKFNTVKGRVYCNSTSNSSGRSEIEIDTLESLYPDINCIETSYTNNYPSGSLLHVGTLTVVNDTATPTVAQVVNTGKYSTVIVDNSNCLLYSESDWNLSNENTYLACIVSPNCVVSGQFYGMMSAGSIKASSAYRTGSNNTASLRFNRTNNSSYGNLSLGFKPFKGIQVTPASAGKHTLKIYLATTGSGDVTSFSNQFVVSAYTKQLDAETGEYIDKDITSSVSEGSIKTDTSTWNNISNYTAYVVEIPVYCYDTTPVEVKVNDTYFSNGFNVYLDTDIEIV